MNKFQFQAVATDLGNPARVSTPCDVTVAVPVVNAIAVICMFAVASAAMTTAPVTTALAILRLGLTPGSS